MNKQRFEEAYDFLVYETGNLETIFNKKRSVRLIDLLELFEYLSGKEEENPLEKWFPVNS